MNKYIQQYEEIVKELVNKSFPKLKEKKIIIEEKDAWYRAKVEHKPRRFKIIMATKLRKFPRASRRRILIHELCHLEIFTEQSWLWTYFEFILYYLILPKIGIKKMAIKMEKESNVLMIKKGYGKLVLATCKRHKKRKLPYSLTEKEIKYLTEQYPQI